MSVARVRLDTASIRDWESFHTVCKQALEFPEFYGRNMDAWIDCMSGLRYDSKMVGIRLRPDELLELELPDVEALRKRMPEVLEELVECTALVNRRYLQSGGSPAVALLLT
jgi:RNAse (barnase) inhibitor barstar